MRKLNTSAALLAASAVVSGCASSGFSLGAAPSLNWDDVRGSRGAVVLAEQPAPAPAGLAAFCERMAAACDEGAGAVSASFRPAMWSADAAEATSAVWRSNPGEDGAAIFARMLAIRAQGGSFAHERHEVPLTETLWRELETVNHEVNGAIAARSDENRYGIAEYWAMPLTERLTPGQPAQGDCEDYALEKRARLIELGWDSEALALAVAHAPGVGMHAVLIAQTDHGDFVLDNLHDAPRPPETLDYRWVSRQAGPSMARWASARIGVTPPAARTRTSELLMAALDPGASEGGTAVGSSARW